MVLKSEEIEECVDVETWSDKEAFEMLVLVLNAIKIAEKAAEAEATITNIRQASNVIDLCGIQDTDDDEAWTGSTLMEDD